MHYCIIEVNLFLSISDQYFVFFKLHFEWMKWKCNQTLHFVEGYAYYSGLSIRARYGWVCFMDAWGYGWTGHKVRSLLQVCTGELKLNDSPVTFIDNSCFQVLTHPLCTDCNWNSKVNVTKQMSFVQNNFILFWTSFTLVYKM